MSEQADPHQGRIDYLELGNEDSLAVPLGPTRTIPENQRLAFTDLQALAPPASLLQIMPRRLVQKYRFIPLAITTPGVNVRLPRHLLPEFQNTLSGTREEVLHLAMVNPQDFQALNIIRQWTSYSLHAIPLKAEAFERFMAASYEAIAGPTSTAPTARPAAPSALDPPPMPNREETRYEPAMKVAGIAAIAFFIALICLLFLSVLVFPEVIPH